MEDEEPQNRYRRDFHELSDALDALNATNALGLRDVELNTVVSWHKNPDMPTRESRRVLYVVEAVELPPPSRARVEPLEGVA